MSKKSSLRALSTRDSLGQNHSLALHKAVLAQLPSAIQLATPSGEIIYANSASGDLWKKDLHTDNSVDLFALLGLHGVDFLDYFYELKTGDYATVAIINLIEGVSYCGLSVASDRWIQFCAFPIYMAGKIAYIALKQDDVTGQHYVNDALRNVASSVAISDTTQIFDSMVLYLARIFDARYVFIGVRNIVDGVNSITSISACDKNLIIDNFSYAMQDTPCAEVYSGKTCRYPDSLQILFPKDLLLADMGIVSYIGAPIFSTSGDTLGVLVVSDQKPMLANSTAEDVLDIFASRAGVELERQAAAKKMRQMAYSDHLTGLANRTALHEYLVNAVTDCQKNGHHILIYIIDIDGFRYINDTYGHGLGDEIITAISERLKSQWSTAFLARTSGDTFCLIESFADQRGEHQHSAKAIITCLAAPYRLSTQTVSLNCSVGVLPFPSLAVDALSRPDDLMRFAETALYQAKGQGRGCYAVFVQALQMKLERTMEITQAMRVGIEENEFYLNYQPLVNQHGKLIGMEALLRWRSSQLGGMIGPADFIPAAEESGIVLKIGQYVFEAACQQIKKWTDDGVANLVPISVNVSGVQFSQVDFVPNLMAIVSQYAVSTKLIYLELTETVLLHDVQIARKKLEDLRKLGFHISLDDFGTGYSSLAYLRELPIDTLKIDKVFISDLRPETVNPLVESIFAIGQHMGMDVVAEGVEQKVQYDSLLQMGCVQFQGFYFMRPASVDAVTALLNDRQKRLPKHG